MTTYLEYRAARDELLSQHIENVTDLETRYYGATGFHKSSQNPAIESWEDYQALLQAEDNRYTAAIAALAKPPHITI